MPLATRERIQPAPALNEILEAEQAVLGRILRDSSDFRLVAELLRPEDFTERLHWGAFAEAGARIAEGKRVAIADLLPRLPSVGLGGVLAGPYLEKLVAEAPAAVDLRHLAQFLARAARERRSKRGDGAGYKSDFYLWANQQAEHLRRGDWSRLDALNLAEEIEDLGRELYNELESRLRIILLHLLKWDHQPEGRARSWTSSIKVQRIDAKRLLDKHHSLAPRIPEALAEAYDWRASKLPGRPAWTKRRSPRNAPTPSTRSDPTHCVAAAMSRKPIST